MVQAGVPYRDLMLAMIANPGQYPTDDERFQVDFAEPERIEVPLIEHRDIDYDPNRMVEYQNPNFDASRPEGPDNPRTLTGSFLDSLIGGRLGYTEGQLREQRDEAAERFMAGMAARGVTGGAALMSAERDVMKPYNDRIALNRQQVVDQSITQFHGIEMDIAIRNRENEINVEKQNQQITLEQEIRNVGFLLQSMIAEGDINTRTAGQMAIARMQAETARRGQSLGALGDLQQLETLSGLDASKSNQRAILEARLADQRTQLETNRLLTQAGLETNRLNVQSELETNRLNTRILADGFSALMPTWQKTK